MKDKKKISIIVGVFLLVLLTIGVTYAFFSYIGNGSTENTISTDSITFLYEEIDQQGAGISITNAVPIEDSVGKQGQAFNFRIISNTNSNVSIPYEINVRQKEGTDDIGDIVKLYLTKVDNSNNETEVELSKYSDLTTVTKNNHQEKLLHIDKVPANSNGYTQKYRLRMWIDNSTDFSDGTYNNKEFSVMVNVYSSGHVETEQDIQAAGRTDITSLSVNNSIITSTNDNYNAELPSGTTEATINVVTANPYTRTVIEKTDSTYTNVIAMNSGIQRLSTSKQISLAQGDNYFRIRLTSEDTTTNSELHLHIYVLEPISGSYATNLDPQDGTTLQGFAKMIYDDNTLIQDELTEAQLKTIDTVDHTGSIYQSTLTNSGNPTYYFRGKVDNNYVKFANMDWRIVRINEDGTIRIILDDSIDTNTYKFNTSTKDIINAYYSSTNQDNSAMKILNDWYDANLIDYNSQIAKAMYYCEAAKVGASGTNYGATITLYNQYTPTFTCEDDINETNIPHSVLNLKIGLLSYDELVYAGAYPGKSNTTFYLYKNFNWWTMSPAGKRHDNLAYVWSCDDNNTNPDWNSVDKSYRYRPVINLKADTTATKQVIDGKTYYVVD